MSETLDSVAFVGNRLMFLQGVREQAKIIYYKQTLSNHESRFVSERT